MYLCKITIFIFFEITDTSVYVSLEQLYLFNGFFFQKSSSSRAFSYVY